MSNSSPVRRQKGAPSTLTIAIATAVIGLLGIAVGNVIVALGNLATERQRVEGQLILGAIDAGDLNDTARVLLFLKDLGLLQDSDGNIERLRQLPAGELIFANGYDEAIDKEATRLQKIMDEFLTSLDVERGADSAKYRNNKAFYGRYGVDLRSLLIRANAYPGNESSVRQYELMLSSLTELEAAHMDDRGSTGDGSIPQEAIPVFRDLFNQSWGAIIRLEVSKRR